MIVTENVDKDFCNTRAPETPKTYQLEIFEKNLLLIINQMPVQCSSEQRFNTERDSQALRNTFGRRGFNVIELRGLSKENLFKELEIFSKRNFTSYGCVAVALLFHGGLSCGMVNATDAQCRTTEVINYISACINPTLLTKPIVFLVQEYGLDISAHDPGAAKLKLSAEYDTLIVRSAVNIPVYFRENDGSFYIQTLCRRIDELAAIQDLETIITGVKREAAYRECSSISPSNIPVVYSALSRKLYLSNYEQAPSNQNVDNLVVPPIGNRMPTLVRNNFQEFDCMLRKLTSYLEVNPTDRTAQRLFEVARNFGDGDVFNSSKQEMLRAIHFYFTVQLANIST